MGFQRRGDFARVGEGLLLKLTEPYGVDSDHSLVIAGKLSVWHADERVGNQDRFYVLSTEPNLIGARVRARGNHKSGRKYRAEQTRKAGHLLFVGAAPLHLNKSFGFRNRWANSLQSQHYLPKDV